MRERDAERGENKRACVNLCAGVHGEQKWALNPLELELHAASVSQYRF